MAKVKSKKPSRLGFLVQDELFVQVLFGFAFLTGLGSLVIGIWLAFFYLPGDASLEGSALIFSYIGAVLLISGGVYFGVGWLGGAVAPPQSEWSRWARNISPADGITDLEGLLLLIVILMIYGLAAVALTYLLRCIGIHGYTKSAKDAD